MTIANGENAASGRGITGKIYKKFLQDGVDVVTMGNHTWDNKDIFEFIDDAKKMVRPANFPEDAWSRNGFVKVNQLELAVINLQARTFMVPLEDPFKKAAELWLSLANGHRSFCGFSWRNDKRKQAMSWF